MSEKIIGPGGGPIRNSTLPEDAKGRNEYPIATGLLDYFPDALAAVAHLSWKATEQHHPGKEVHWNRSVSTDEPNTLMRHFVQRGTRDKDGERHSTKVAWRALALLQKEIEEEPIPMSTTFTRVVGENVITYCSDCKLNINICQCEVRRG